MSPKSLTNNKKLKQKGFTLVELMVVMAVIAILFTTALVAFTGVQKGARDTTRKNNIAQYRTALENYYSTNFAYPDPGNSVPCQDLSVFLSPIFLSQIPQDPSNYGSCVYSPISPGDNGAGDFVIGQTLETGGYWPACSIAVGSGKICHVSSNMPGSFSQCPCTSAPTPNPTGIVGPPNVNPYQ